MLKERIRNLLGAEPDHSVRPVPPLRTPINSPGSPFPLKAQSRHSNGLDQFFGSVRDQEGLSLLDLAGASQANVSYITNLRHRIYSEDFLTALDYSFGDGDFYANQKLPALATPFLEQNLNFGESQFDGALVWDTLQFLSQPLLQFTVERLHQILRPNAYMLAFFHADEKATSIPLYNYRITDAKTLTLAPRGQRKPAQFFNNRSLEKLFQQFSSVKFFLTRDALREVIVKR